MLQNKLLSQRESGSSLPFPRVIPHPHPQKTLVSHASAGFTNTTAVGAALCFEPGFRTSLGWLGYLSASCFPGHFAKDGLCHRPTLWQQTELIQLEPALAHTWSWMTAIHLLTCKLTKHEFEQMLSQSLEMSKEMFSLSATFLQKWHK